MDTNADVALCIGIAVIYAMMVATIVVAFIAMYRSGEWH
jgi:hypothetical protein